MSLDPVTFNYRGRVWTQVGRELYTRKDGSQTELIRWVTPCCAPGCSGVVEIKTPSKFDTTKAFESKHCPEHRLTQAEIMERRRAQIAANRQKKAGAL